MDNTLKNRTIVVENNIKVICRFRPLNNLEKKIGSKFIVNFPTSDNENCVSIGGKEYFYDKVFKPSTSQDKVYNEAAKSIVTDVLSGYNGTIFAYGQTSSGKTHTMEGIIGDPKKQGIIPRICNDIFNHIYSMEEDVEFQIKVSYYEIYMNRVRDLLDVKKANLHVHEDKNHIPFVKGTTERFVSTPEEVFEIIEEGKSNRHIIVTSMNEHSSRSHSIFLINVEQKNLQTQKKLSGKLYLVDLAGFEKVSKTGAEGTVLGEAKNINKSLSALGNVISGLADGNKTHIPYRDSKLTRVLQESLGGNAKTTIIICCSPASTNESETRSTLHFGKRVKTIKNSVSINEELTVEDLNRRYEREKKKVAQLKDKLVQLQLELLRWRQGEIVSPREQVSLIEELDVITNSLSEETTTEDEKKTIIPFFPKIFSAIPKTERQKLKQERERFYQWNENKYEKKEKESISRAYRSYVSSQQERIIINDKIDDANKRGRKCLPIFANRIMNYDKKSPIASSKIRNRELTDKNFNNRNIFNASMPEFDQLYNLSTHERRLNIEILGNLLKDLAVFGVAISRNEYLNFEIISKICEKSEELLTIISKFYGKKMKSDVKNLVERYQNLHLYKNDFKKISKYENKYGQGHLSISQNDAHMQVFSKSMTAVGIESIQDDFSELKTTKQIQVVASNRKNANPKESAKKMHIGLEKQIDILSDIHQRQIVALQDDISAKDEYINQLKDSNRKLIWAYQRLKSYYEKLNNKEIKNSVELKKYLLLNEKREKTRKDLNKLDNLIAKELQILHNLRKNLIENLQVKIKKTSITDENEANNNMFLKKISELQTDLDQLSKSREQLMKDNSDLLRDIVKISKELGTSHEYIETLEKSLSSVKEIALNDRKRYQSIVNTIQEELRHKNLLLHKQNVEMANSVCMKPDGTQTNSNNCKIV